MGAEEVSGGWAVTTPITWQSIGKKMLDWEAQKLSRQQAIARLEQLSQQTEPIPPQVLIEIVAILKTNVA